MTLLKCIFNDESIKCLLCTAVPLYQEYCLQEMKGCLERMSKSPVSEVVSPRYVQELQSHIGFGSHSEAALPPPELLEPTPKLPLPFSRPTPTVTPGTLWQDLEEVKASGILSDMTPREIHLQEVGFCSFAPSQPKSSLKGVAIHVQA